jgi:uncharacterized membrane protein YphA (DoxX/SURF4 family)
MVGITAVRGGAGLIEAADADAAAWAIGLVLVISGAALVAGLMTPGAGATLAIVALVLASLAGDSTVQAFDGTQTTVFLVVDATALVLLGPGALSIDARLFGRREIRIPNESRLRQS